MHGSLWQVTCGTTMRFDWPVPLPTPRPGLGPDQNHDGELWGEQWGLLPAMPTRRTSTRYWSRMNQRGWRRLRAMRCCAALTHACRCTAVETTLGRIRKRAEGGVFQRYSKLSRIPAAARHGDADTTVPNIPVVTDSCVPCLCMIA